jgi:hypothetical protein
VDLGISLLKLLLDLGVSINLQINFRCLPVQDRNQDRQLVLVLTILSQLLLQVEVALGTLMLLDKTKTKTLLLENQI